MPLLVSQSQGTPAWSQMVMSGRHWIVKVNHCHVFSVLRLEMLRVSTTSGWVVGGWSTTITPL